MTAPIIRPWQNDDVNGIARIMASHTLWQRYGVTVKGATVRLRTLWHDQEQGFVAVDPQAGKVIGFALYNQRSFGDSGYIRLFGVDTSATSQGLGRRLLSVVEAALSQAGVARLLLLCAEWNTQAQRFYEGNGFARVGLLPDWVIDGTNEVIYAKHLMRIGSPLKR